MTRTHRRIASAVAAVVAGAVAVVVVNGTVQSPAEAAVVKAAAPALPGPSGDAFYEPPSPLPAGEPGDVIRWRPTVAPLNALNANAWQVMYLSTNALGERHAVTGTILTPKFADTAKAPIVGYAVGTQGPAFKCTPSKAIERGKIGRAHV